jgi:hypothetical protein
MGIPWEKEKGAVYSLDSNCNYYRYTVTCGKHEYNLQPLDTMTYKAWRKDRLQKKKDLEKSMKKEAEAKIREHEEAKKKEVEAAILLHMLVQSTSEDAKTAAISGVRLSDVKSISDAAANEDDWKPRTVSFEGREDDTAQPGSTIILSDPMKLESSYMQLPHDSVDESVHMTYVHPLVVDMGTYAFWNNADGMFPCAYTPSHGDKNMHVHEPKQMSVQSKVKIREEIFSGANTGAQIGDYFENPRPPEQAAHIWKFQPWRLLSLKSSGWGPPAEHKEDGIHVN